MATADIKASTFYYYYIQSQLNGMVLDIKGGNSSAGASIINYPKKDGAGADNQLWYFVDVGNGQYAIHSKMNGMALDVKGSGGAGAPVITYPTHGGPNQAWSLQFKGTEAFICSGLGKDLVIDVKGANKGAGAEVIVWTKKDYDNDNQQWEFIPA